MTDEDRLKLDYERTAQYYFHLAEVRFKLLALLPIASGAALIVVPEHFSSSQTLALGVLGLVVTIGILLYDQRNSQIYNCLIGRLNLIEESLRMPAMRGNKQVGGAFLDRPGKDRRRMVLWALPANHGLALDLIYASSVAAWLFIITSAGLSLLGSSPETQLRYLFLIPAVLGILLFINLRCIDNKSSWEGDLPSDVKDRINKTLPKVSN